MMVKYNKIKFFKLIDRILFNNKEKVEEMSRLLDETMKDFLINIETDVLSDYFLKYIKSNLIKNYTLEEIILLNQTAFLIGGKRLSQITQMIIFKYLLDPIKQNGLLDSHLMNSYVELKRKGLDQKKLIDFVNKIKNKISYKQ